MWNSEENRKRVLLVTWIGSALLIVVALILWLLSPTFEEVIVDDQSPEAQKILFIGNSLTYTHNVPAQFVDIAKAQDSNTKLYIKQLVYPNYTLRDHWNRKEAQKVIRSQNWDYVILQGHSSSPIQDPKTLIKYINLFDQIIKEQKAKTVLYATWTDSDRLERHENIVKVFRYISSQPNMILAPVGEAVFLAWKKYPNLKLLQVDKHHPTPTGSYLVAATLYITIFKKHINIIPHDMLYSKVQLSGETKVKLNKIALSSCKKYHLIDESTAEAKKTDESTADKNPNTKSSKEKVIPATQ